MKKQIILASSIVLLASGLHALTLEEQVAVNTIEIGFNSANIDEINTKMTSLEDRISNLETRVTRLESFHDIREFTIYGTSGLDITKEEFIAKLTSLNYQSGEFLYIKGVGFKGTNEICTSNAHAAKAFDYYISSRNMYTHVYSPTNVWQRLDGSSEWTTVYHFLAQSHISYAGLNFRTRLENMSYHVYNTVIPDFHDEDAPYSFGQEIYTNAWDTEADNSMTYRVGTTRLGVCGF